MSWTFTAQNPITAQHLVAALDRSRLHDHRRLLDLRHHTDDPRLTEYWTRLAAATDEALATPEPTLPRSSVWQFQDTGARMPFEDAYFARRRRLAALGLSALAGDDRALAALPDRIAAVCEEPAWALPAHGGWEPTGATVIDLFAAETSATLAELVTVLGDRLDARVPELVRAEVSRRVLDPLADPATSFWWEAATHNWSAVCAGASGVAALLLEGDDERLVRVLTRVLAALDAYLSGFGADGGCAEGMGYWSYGMVHFIAFADLVERLTGGSIRLADDPRALAAASFPGRVALPGGAQVTFSDTTDDPPASSATGWWHARGLATPATPIEVVGQDPCARWLSISRAPLWLPPAVNPDERHDGATGGRHTDLLEHTGWLVVAADPFALAVKGGHNAEPHNHLDLGQVCLWIGGEQLLLDPGSGVYTREYFDAATRYDFFEPSGRAHNAPMLDDAQQVLGDNARAVVTHQSAGAFELDLTSAYAQPSRVSRRVEWADGVSTVTVRDVIEGPVTTAGWCLVSEAEPVHDGLSVRWVGRHGTLGLDVATGRVLVRAFETRHHHGAPRTLWITEITAPTTEGALEQRLSFDLRDAPRR
ncbi:heparinase II/III domain-containing protein [Aestuariimicrobium soli]|uniref:heparinase II/III domain-containing protein n=1 Tax=Aestuariimicrobium soli TaxID=2035834 RepID=UPI003EB78558